MSEERGKFGYFLPGNQAARGNGQRKPSRRITNRIHQKLNVVDLNGRQVDELIADKIIEMALAGNMQAIEFVADRVEGKVRQAVELSGHEGRPIQFQSITSDMTAEEAIAAYLDAVGNPEAGIELDMDQGLIDIKPEGSA